MYITLKQIRLKSGGGATSFWFSLDVESVPLTTLLLGSATSLIHSNVKKKNSNPPLQHSNKIKFVNLDDNFVSCHGNNLMSAIFQCHRIQLSRYAGPEPSCRAQEAELNY